MALQNKCENCGKEYAKHKCGKCSSALYCNSRCQHKHEQAHRPQCELIRANPTSRVAETHIDMGKRLLTLGRYTEAVDSFGRAVKISKEQGIRGVCATVGNTLRDMGGKVLFQGEKEAALQLYEGALQAYRDDTTSDQHCKDLNVAAAFTDIGSVMTVHGDSIQALESLHQALNKIDKDWTDTVAQRQRAKTLQCVGTVYFNQGKLEEALQNYQESLHVDRLVVAVEKVPLDMQSASTLSNIGAVLYKQGRFEKAIKSFEVAYRLHKRILGDHKDTAFCAQTLAEILFKTGKSDEAKELFLECARIYAVVNGEGNKLAIEAMVLANRCTPSKNKESDKAALSKSPFSEDLRELASEMGAVKISLSPMMNTSDDIRSSASLC